MNVEQSEIPDLSGEIASPDLSGKSRTAGNNEQTINTNNEPASHVEPNGAGWFDWEHLLETEPTVSPIIDIIESKNDFQIKVYMPGVKKEDIYLKLDDDILTVFGKSEGSFGMELNHADEVKFILREKNFGHYFRKFFISDKVDSSQINAKLDNGLLNIILPKHERIKPKEISIN